MLSTPRLRRGAAASLVVALAAGIAAGCKKEDPPPPMPQTTEVSAPPPPTVSLAPVSEDASDEDAADKKGGTGKPVDPVGLRACCTSLAQNAASMPPPNNLYAANAAAYCNAAVATVTTAGQRDALFAGIRSAMRGGSLPAACK